MRKLLLIVFLSAVSVHVLAASTGYRKIYNFGCHNTDNTCYAYLEGEVVGPDACKANSVRWNVKNDANGQATLSLVAAAFFSGKKVSFNLLDTCYPNQANFPAVGYINIQAD